MSTFLNLSNVELIEKSLSRTSLNLFSDEKNPKTQELQFAWIESVPESLEFAINM